MPMPNDSAPSDYFGQPSDKLADFDATGFRTTNVIGMRNACTLHILFREIEND